MCTLYRSVVYTLIKNRFFFSEKILRERCFENCKSVTRNRFLDELVVLYYLTTFNASLGNCGRLYEEQMLI